jgi:hypothetical protein
MISTGEDRLSVWLHPDSMELDFRAFALVALHDAWPCPSTDFDKRFKGK